MKEDIRYSEFLFLRAVAQNSIPYFCPYNPDQPMAVGLDSAMYAEMALMLLEELYIRFDDHVIQQLVGRLRGEIPAKFQANYNVKEYEWNNPRSALENKFVGTTVYCPRITYRGLRRIEELRDLLKRERILDDFGVLLSMRYARKDLEDAIHRSSDFAVSVLYFDMDHFGIINKTHGQEAGDVVMKEYLESVHVGLGNFGTGYRGVGDEVMGLIVGQGHQKAVEISEAIRKRVEALKCEYKGQILSGVSVSIGVATSPPEQRTMELETLAESRKRLAKESGRNQVVHS